MKVWNKYRQYQFVYVFVDLLSSLLVWTAFLGFRWLVYEGKVLSVDTVFIPMFNFYLPLILYPLGCFAVYYLSGYYLRPFRKRYLKDLSDTLLSSAVIALGAFFVIIIDDVVDSYQRYTISLLVLFALQFALSYLPRLCVTFLFRHFSSSWSQVYTIHSLEQADVLLRKHLSESLDEVVIDLPDDACESDIYSIINRLYPLEVQIAVRPRLYDMLTGAASIMDVEDVPLVKTITFTIREGIVWHDGTPFTAEDVKWTFEYYPTVPGANTVMTDVINDVKAITIDGNKVIFEFNNPQPNALTVFSQWPVLPKHCLENVTPENFAADTFWQAPIGTGPFKVETVKLGEYTTLVRNADYFITGTGNIEKIYMYPSTDAGDTNLITNAQAGNIDYAFCKDSAQVQQLQDMEGYNVETVNVTFPRYIFVNMFERPAK